MASPGEINGLQEVCQILLRSRNPLPSNTLSATTLSPPPLLHDLPCGIPVVCQP